MFVLPFLRRIIADGCRHRNPIRVDSRTLICFRSVVRYKLLCFLKAGRPKGRGVGETYQRLTRKYRLRLSPPAESTGENQVEQCRAPHMNCPT